MTVVEKFQEQIPYLQVTQKILSLFETLEVPQDEDTILQYELAGTYINILKNLLGSDERYFTASLNLDNIATRLPSSLNTANAQLDAYLTNNSVAHLVKFNLHIQNAIVYLQQFFIILPHQNSSEDKVKETKKIFSDFVVTSKEKREELEASVTSLQNELSKRNSELGTLQQNLEKTQDRTNTLISDWQKQFSKAQEVRNSSFHDQIKELENKFDEQKNKIIENNEQQLKEKYDAYADTIERKLEKAEEHNQKIKDLFKLVSENSVAGSYDNYATSEKRSAFWLMCASLGFIVIGILLHLYNYFFRASGAGGDHLWESYIAMLPLTGLLMYGAIYTGSLANKHRKNSQRMKWFALNVKAIDPYLENLDEQERKEIKKELSKEFFKIPEENSKEDGKHISIDQLQKIKNLLGIKDA